MSNDNAFVRGIRRAVEQRKQREQAITVFASSPEFSSVDSPEFAKHQSEQCSVNAEQYRLNLVNTILKHMRKRKEQNQ
ncbi:MULTISPECIES: hypothetical protein [unclassified Pseudomonas]|uniref:hypothetical protein n=1 Tax=unclassified Pseudomonas TaxID=196821 RepID=UPI002097AB2C|nr:MULTISPECIES: hypothetical protein [unclassified Pseudomonas]MCO7506774.1 hypothetical protein [Pseudomonas sp. VE 267-6A]MCO7531482.1 hypothetical protein [Pseudomonas sp. 2]